MSMLDLRTRWRAGTKTSTLSPAARHCALVIADWWPSVGPSLVRVRLADLSGETGLSRRTAQYALRELADAGWIELVEPAHHHNPPGYRPTIPDHPQPEDRP